MKDKDKTKAQLIEELVELRQHVSEMEASEILRGGAKDALWTNDEWYRSLTNDILDTSAVGVILLDADFRIVWVNQALERYFGFCRNEIIGKDKRHLIRECIMDIFENPGSFSEKVLATYGDNTYVENFECHVLPGEEREECWLEHWSQPIRSGLYIGGRVEHYYDISERKQVEEELKRHSHHLNELVNVRTAELSKANEQLHQEITKCKQIEVYLQQSEESARALLNAIPGSALLIDTQGIILNINEIAARAIGYSPDEIINKRSYDLLPPSVAKSRKAYTKKVARTRHAIEFEDERDGRVIYNSLNPVLNQQGQVTRIAVFSQDITDSKQMEMAFQKSKDYLNTLMDSMADAVFTVKMPARKIEFVNQAVYELLGYHSEELIDQSTRQFYPDEGSFDSFGQALKDALDQGQSQVRQEQVLLRKNGEQLWTEINTAFLFSNGQLSQVISVVRDIAERKQAEEKLQKSEEQYGRLVENAPDILYAFSDKRGGVYYSNRVRTVLGHTPSYLLEHPLVWHDSIHPDDLPLVDQAIAGLKIGKLFDIEYRIWDANKNLHWFRDRPIGQWKDGDETIVEGLASDITERKRIEEALQQRVEQLAALQATTLEITSPHDLSTLLRTIVERATSLLKAPGGGMYLCDPVQEEVRCVVSYNTFNDYTGTVLKYGEGSAGTVALTGQPLAIDDYRTWPMRAKVYEEDQPFTAVLSMPLIWQDRVSGVIHVLDSVKGRRFTQSDIELLTLFANQAAIAIHNAQLFEAEQEQRRLAEALSEISQTLTSTLHLDEVLDKVLNNVERIVPHQGTNIHLLDEKSEIVQIHQIKGYQNAHLGKPGKGTTRHVCEIPLYRQMMEARQAVVVSDTHAEPNWTLFAGTHWVRSYLGIPICRGERVFGFLNLDSATPGFFTDKHAHKLQAFANQAAIAIENARLFAGITQRSNELAALLAATSIISSSLDLEKVLWTVAEQITKSIHVEACAISKWDREANTVTLLVEHAPDDWVIGSEWYQPFDLTEHKRARRVLEETRSDQLQSDDPVLTTFERDYLDRAEIKTLLMMPIRASNQVIGLAEIMDSRTLREFTDREIDFLQSLTNQAGIAIEKAQLFAAEQRQRAELERTNKLISALVHISARVQAAPDPETVMETLGTELKELELACTVASFDPEDSSLMIRHLSVGSKALSAIEKIVKRPISGFKLALKTVTPYIELFEHHRAIVASGSEVVSFATAVLPDFTRPVINRILKLAGVQPDIVAIFLPLVIEDRMLGVLWVWGRDLQAVDLPVFSTFASQLSVTLENARLFEQVRAGRENLQALSHRLVEIQETERRNIALELHDEVGQNLTALKLLLDSTLNISSDAETKAAWLHEAGELVDQISSTVQNLSLNLRPSMLDDLGLLPTLIWHFDRFGLHSNIKVDFKHHGLESRLPTNVELAAYRIVQEALTNVVRYADVDQVIVRVWADQDEIHIQVEDQGAGFDTAAVLANQDSAGLLGMNERSTLLGGSLDIISTPGEGTTVMAVLPLGGRLERRIHER